MAEASNGIGDIGKCESDGIPTYYASPGTKAHERLSIQYQHYQCSPREEAIEVTPHFTTFRVLGAATTLHLA